MIKRIATYTADEIAQLVWNDFSRRVVGNFIKPGDDEIVLSPQVRGSGMFDGYVVSVAQAAGETVKPEGGVAVPGL